MPTHLLNSQISDFLLLQFNIQVSAHPSSLCPNISTLALPQQNMVRLLDLISFLIQFLYHSRKERTGITHINQWKKNKLPQTYQSVKKQLNYFKCVDTGLKKKSNLAIRATLYYDHFPTSPAIVYNRLLNMTEHWCPLLLLMLFWGYGGQTKIFRIGCQLFQLCDRLTDRDGAMHYIVMKIL